MYDLSPYDTECDSDDDCRPPGHDSLAGAHDSLSYKVFLGLSRWNRFLQRKLFRLLLLHISP